MMTISIPFSVVRYFQSRVTALVGVELDLLKSPKRDLELGKAKLLYQYCKEDLNLVMQVIEQSLLDGYLLNHPTLAIVYSKVEELLFKVRRDNEMVKQGGWLERESVKDDLEGGYLNRDYQTERRIVL